jgi:ABC-type lipoprotein release transport system permease subunit
MALAFGGSLLLRHLITRIDVYDGVPYLTGFLLVMLAALTAAFFPSSRAARINPVETLRAD